LYQLFLRDERFYIMKRNPHLQGIAVKKQYGQHFLRQQNVVDAMVNKVTITEHSSIFEIGCGDGFLTRAILQTACARLWVFEIDQEWAEYVKSHYPDPRMTIFEENILDVDFTRFQTTKWTLLANLPYQITFPILHMLQRNKHLLDEGVIMVQEEVAQKIIKSSGRGYGFVSLFFQHHFEWQLMMKISPGAFFPPPAVDSRLLYFKPRSNMAIIAEEESFWKFIKLCFGQPRRTLKNNLAHTHYAAIISKSEFAALRAQQMVMADFLQLWDQILLQNHTQQQQQ